MADNTQIDVMADGDIIATDDISGVKHQRVKVQHGADGSATDVSLTSPMPTFIHGETPNKATAKIQLNSAGTLIVSDYASELVAGSIVGSVPFSKFGRMGSMNAADSARDVWDGSGTYTGQPTGAPELVEVFSADAADAAAGTGMRTCRISGLKSSTSTAEESEEITLNGTTGVDSSSSWYRIYRVVGLTYGSGGANAGVITVRHKTTTANIFAEVAAGRNQSSVAAFTIPAGSTAILKGLDIRMSRTSGAAGSCNVTVRARALNSGGYNAIYDYTLTDSQVVNPPIEIPQSLAAGTDLKIRVESVSDNGTVVTAAFSGLIFANL